MRRSLHGEWLRVVRGGVLDDPRFRRARDERRVRDMTIGPDMEVPF